MANTKISALGAATALAGTEETPVVQSAATVKATINQIKTYTSASPTLVTPTLGVATGTSVTLTPAINASAITVATQTHTASAPVVDAAQTWNNAAITFTGWKLNITSTASAAASLLADFQLAGVSKVNLDKTGVVTSTKNAAHAFSVTVSGQNPVAFGRNSTVGGMSLFDGTNATPADNNAQALLSAGKFMLASTGVIGFSSSNVTQAMDSGIARKQAKIPEINTGTAGSYVGTALLLGPMTVAQLPVAAAGLAGARATVSDATAPTFLAALVGGGAVVCPAFCDGTAWLAG